MHHSVRDGVAGIFEFFVGGKEDHLHGQALFVDYPRQLDAGHSRHFNVREHDVHRVAPDIIQRAAGVFKHRSGFKAHAFPGEIAREPVADLEFIVHNDQTVHKISSCPDRMKGSALF